MQIEMGAKNERRQEYYSFKFPKQNNVNIDLVVCIYTRNFLLNKVTYC